MKAHITIKLYVTLLILMFFPGIIFAGNINGTIKAKGLRSPANILVYLTKAPQTPVDLSGAKFVMDQSNLTFLPHILPILVGTTVQFPNNDKVSHNVFSLSRAKKFNLGSYQSGESKTVLFDKPGIIELRCDVHAEMLAYILVMKNPYWAITDEGGKFQIPDQAYQKNHGIKGVKELPPGKYYLKTWHEKLKTSKKAVIVPEKGDVSVPLNLGRGRPGVLSK
ncbi:methylamine utilization protein [Thermodesulfobacteriota bacterium]